MTRAQNKRYILRGCYLLSFTSAWIIIQIQLLKYPSFDNDVFKYFCLISTAVLGFSTFVYLIFLGIQPWFNTLLQNSGALKQSQITALEILPSIED